MVAFFGVCVITALLSDIQLEILLLGDMVQSSVS